MLYSFYSPRKTIKSLPFVLLILPTMAFGQGTSLQDIGAKLAPSSDSPTVIYSAREFITMNPDKPYAEAIAVKDGKFIAVGTRQEVGKITGPNARLDKRFAGKVVMPGFIEQHVHPVLAAITMNTHVISIEDWDSINGFSPAVRDPERYKKRLQQAINDFSDKRAENEAFVTWGYHHYMHGRYISREYLDKLAPDFPVLVWHRSTHEAFLNTAALKVTGIDKTYINTLPESAQKQADLEKGHLFEQAFFGSLSKLSTILATPEKLKQGLEFTETFYHSSGITTAAEPGGITSKPIQDAINAVYSDDATPFNHFFMVMGRDMADRYPDDAKTMIGESNKLETWGEGRTAYLPKQAKLLSDGAIFSQLMMMRDGYADGHHGAWIMIPKHFDYAFQAYWDAGYQIHIHNNGDAGLDILLAALEKAQKRKPRENHRSVLIHFGFAQREQVERWIELGGIVSSNPYYVTALAGRYGKLGMRNSEVQNMVPHKYVLDNGGSLSFHSDMPMAPAKPLHLVWAAVNRLTYEGKVSGPEHKVPLDNALKAITIDAAYSIQQEEHVGSIEVGKDANLTILEKSPYDVKPEQLKDIPIWGTMLEGRVQPIGKATKSARTKQIIKPPANSDAQLKADTVKLLTRLLNHKHIH